MYSYTRPFLAPYVFSFFLNINVVAETKEKRNNICNKNGNSIVHSQPSSKSSSEENCFALTLTNFGDRIFDEHCTDFDYPCVFWGKGKGKGHSRTG